MGNVDQDGIQVLAELKDGKEYGDPTPVAPPIGIRKSPSMAERIQMMVRRELSERAEAMGMESFEEANDFDIPDDPQDPSTPYEANFDPVEDAARERLKTEEYRAKVDARHKEMRRAKYPQEVDDGESDADEGGARAPREGSGKSGKVVKDDAKPKSDVRGGGSKERVANPDTEE